MRSRNIKPGFWVNEDLGELSCQVRLLFIGLWCLADKNGVLEDRPRRIKGELFRYDDVSADAIASMINKLEELGFLTRYRVNSQSLIHITNFLKHQSPHHTEAKPTLPMPTQEDLSGSPLDHREPTVSSPLHHGGNPPDSLIPDSLIPDSLIPEKSKSVLCEIDTETAESQPQPEPQQCAATAARHANNGRFLLTSKKHKLTGWKLQGFEEFWEAFADKRSKAAAAESWRCIPDLSPGLIRKIVEGALCYARDRPAILAAKGTPKMAQGWLTDRRWEDWLDENGMVCPVQCSSPLSWAERMKVQGVREPP